jgi:hypothetical protein
LRRESSVATISRLTAESLGVFRGEALTKLGVTRKQIAGLRATGVIERVLPDVYRMTAVAPSRGQTIRAALLWAGPDAMAAGRSAGELYALDGVVADRPEIAVPRSVRVRSQVVIVHRPEDSATLMPRRHHGLRVTGVETTLAALAATLGNEAFEIACEDARRRRLTSVPALESYLARFARAGRPGISTLRDLLVQLDPVHAARSTLEVKTRRLLVANGFTDFVRELPLSWGGRTYRFDFAFDGAVSHSRSLPFPQRVCIAPRISFSGRRDSAPVGRPAPSVGSARPGGHRASRRQ